MVWFSAGKSKKICKNMEIIVGIERDKPRSKRVMTQKKHLTWCKRSSH